MEKRRNRVIDDFTFSFLLGLMVSGNLISRTHKNNMTSRLVYQTNTNHKQALYDYILKILVPFSSKGLLQK